MTEENQEPPDESVRDETAAPLPERDAMSLIGGPGMGIATTAPETTPLSPGLGTVDQPVPGEAGPAR